MYNKLKSILNAFRNLLLFEVFYPWIKYGSDVHCQWSTSFWSPHKQISLGNHVGIGGRCVFLADVAIENRVLIGAQLAFLISDDNNFDMEVKTI